MLDLTLTEDELWAELPGLPVSELPSLVTHPATRERHIVKVLERADLPENFLNSVAHSKWARSLRVQFSLVNHPSTPVGEAMNLVKFLFWRDLNLTIQNFKVSTEVRHQAEAVLLQRLPAMATGEKITLGRLAAGRVLKAMRKEKDPQVIRALLKNSRLVEEDVLFLINQPRTPSPVLGAVARDPKWSPRVDVRIGLIRNARTPLAAVIPFIGSLNMNHVRNLATDPKVPQALRRMLQTRLGRSS
jgi:hypothetical protein